MQLLAQGILKIGAGVRLTAENSVNLVFQNSGIVNDGEILQDIGGGAFLFKGSENARIEGSGITSVNRLELWKSSNSSLALGKNVEIKSAVYFGEGFLDLDNFVLHLGSIGTLENENSLSRARTTQFGYIERTQSLVSPVQANPGNLGAVITSTSNLGLTVIRRGHREQTGLDNQNNSISRYYDIIPSANSGIQATLGFKYFDEELNTVPENTLSLWKSEDNIHWIYEGYTNRDMVLNQVEKEQITGFSRWTLGPEKICERAEQPVLSVSPSNICPGSSAVLSVVSGNLNSNDVWTWYAGSCGGTPIGTGSTITVFPSQGTTYYARGEGGCASPGDCTGITVDLNTSMPAVSGVTGPMEPVAVNMPVSLTVSFASLFISEAKVDWGDNGDIQTVHNPANNFALSHTYSSPGVFTVSVTIINSCGVSSEPYLYEYNVVYDPLGGFVTGGGWINSPAGAYLPDETLTGRANFGFVSKYQKGASVPSGTTEFRFQAAGMFFSSTNYDWLVVAGSRAQFKGTGKVNGVGLYGFMVTAIDGDLSGNAAPDRLRIKIWDKQNNDAIVYDNQAGAADDAAITTTIAGGSVVIHGEKSKPGNVGVMNKGIDMLDKNSEPSLLVKVLPNPSSNHFTLNLKGNGQGPIQLRVTDVQGRIVEARILGAAAQTVQIGDRWIYGSYIVEVIQGSERKTVQLVKLK